MLKSLFRLLLIIGIFGYLYRKFFKKKPLQLEEHPKNNTYENH